MTFNHVHLILLDPRLSRQVDRLLAVLERLDAGMTPDEQAVVLKRLKAQAKRLRGIATAATAPAD